MLIGQLKENSLMRGHNGTPISHFLLTKEYLINDQPRHFPNHLQTILLVFLFPTKTPGILH